MKNIIINTARDNRDLSPIFVGEHKCESGHTYGPFIRDHTIIHAVISGRGKLYDKHGTHEIGAGELFVICRGEEATYTADKDDPWHYVWIAFVGEGEALYKNGVSVYPAPDRAIMELREEIELNSTSFDGYCAVLYSLTHKLLSSGEEVRDRLFEIKRYLEYNYMNPISVSEVAKTYGYERSHLYRIFAQRYGVGVKEFLTEVRMTRAKEFLALGYTVSETAYLVGFRDEFGFSRSFKKHLGIPPSRVKSRDNR